MEKHIEIPEPLLRDTIAALNEIKNTGLKGTRYRNTYQLVADLEKLLEKEADNG